jgi:pSer/pThr/pTyr-binding forkhead associated (FHA) protein
MLSADELISFASESIDTCATEDLQQRLSLYQVFLRVYEHHRGLLDEILRLENSGSKALASVSFPYVQGVVADDQIHLVTNLLGGNTQALRQPQHTWLVGRDSRKVNIAVQDTRLSRCHAGIRYAEGGFHLFDLASSNGSFINGEQVWRSTLLKDGDRVRLGSLSFVFFVCQSTRTLPTLNAELSSSLQQAAQSASRAIPAETKSAGSGANPSHETFDFPYGIPAKTSTSAGNFPR